jgi:plasmid stability protein
MTSITIHDLDDSVAKLIKAKARAEGTSLNQTIKRLLEAALGVRPRPSSNRKHFEKFSGTWSKADFADFERATREFGRVDPRDWK